MRHPWGRDVQIGFGWRMGNINTPGNHNGVVLADLETPVPPNHRWAHRFIPIITPFIPVGIVQRVYTPEPSLLVV